jgi:hypothetical protein
MLSLLWRGCGERGRLSLFPFFPFFFFFCTPCFLLEFGVFLARGQQAESGKVGPSGASCFR